RQARHWPPDSNPLASTSRRERGIMNSFARTIVTSLATIRAGTLATGCASIAVLALALVGPAASTTPRSTASTPSQVQRALDQLVAAGAPGAVVLARQGN